MGDFLLSYSIGNLAFAPFWYLFFARNSMGLDETFVPHFYELPQEFGAIDSVAAAVAALFLSGTIFAFLHFCRRRSPSTHARVVVLMTVPTFGLLAVLFCYVLLRQHQLAADPFSGLVAEDFRRFVHIAIAFSVVACAMGVLIFCFGNRAYFAIRLAILATSPFGLIMTVNSVAAHIKVMPPDANFYAVDYSLAEIQRLERSRPTVLFVIFDEWDQRLTFEDRLPGLKLPEIDRLASEAFVATNVRRAAQSTFLSIPGILAGRRATDAVRTPGDDMRIVWADNGESSSLRAQSVLFGDAHRHGFNTAVIATAIHPYCRLFRKDISTCWVDNTPFDYEYSSILNRIDDVVVGTVRHMPYLRRLVSEPEQKFHSHPVLHLTFKYRDLAERRVLDPRWTFVFMHIRLPHDPYIYELKAGTYGIVDPSDKFAYWGNLVALDKFIGHMRATFEQAGRWDDVTMVLTADHGYRDVPGRSWLQSDKKKRVPLIIKLAGHKSHVSFDRQASAMKIRSAMRAIFAGEVHSPADLGHYLSDDATNR